MVEENKRSYYKLLKYFMCTSINHESISSRERRHDVVIIHDDASCYTNIVCKAGIICYIAGWYITRIIGDKEGVSFSSTHTEKS